MSLVGLDIGSKTIKIVELEKENSGFKLLSSGIVGYSHGTNNYSDDLELETIAEALKKLHKEANISGRDVSIALPEPQVFTRTIKFPSLSDAEIASAVKWEAEEYIPIPATEAIIQHQILERKENQNPPQVIVLLVAAPRTLVDKYIKIVQMAGLVPVGVETELMALVRALAPSDKTVLLIDFGARSTDIAIAKSRNLYFSRSIPTAGEAFSRAIAQSLGVELKQAEEYKRAYGLSGGNLEGKIKNALDPVFRVVTDEIKKAIHYYQSEEGGEIPSLVLLSGGTSGMPETVSFLAKLLGIEVEVGNPFTNISMDGQTLNALTPYAPLYSIAVGLAERGGI